MRLTRVLAVVCLVILALGLSSSLARNAHAQTSTTSIVQISTTGTCCQPKNGLFSISVLLDLAPGLSINGFDVIINYTNGPAASQQIVRAESVSYSDNIFDPYSPQVLNDCIDGISQGTSGACTDAPSAGQVELTEAILGGSITTGGRLFSIGFQVTGMGTSVFTIVRANVINPYGDPSNPQTIDPVFIPVIKQDGIFGNINGAVPFFNYQPDDTSITPAILPNRQVDFNATSSFAGYNQTLGFKQYSWNFGDGSANRTGATTNHIFALPRNYTVTLAAIDNNNELGKISRVVDVQSTLGSILLTVRNQQGSAITERIIVRLFNSSGSSAPFTTLTVAPNGNVQFNSLSQSNTYYLTFIAQGYQNLSKTESVKPGWTTMDTIYLTPTPAPADYSGLIYIASILGALGVVAAAIIYAKRPSRNKQARRPAKPAASRLPKKIEKE
jgi:PKD domain